MEIFKLFGSLSSKEQETLKNYVDQEIIKLRQEIKRDYMSKRDHEDWMKKVLRR